MTNSYRNRPRDEAAEYIESIIAEGRMKPHDKLPSERDLSAEWGVSRATLRSAIRKLIVEGKLYSRRGAGTFVAPPKIRRNLQDMEPMVAVAQKAGYRLRSQALVCEVQQSTRSIARKLGLEPGAPVFFLQRLRLFNDMPLMIELSHIDSRLCPGLERYDFSKESLYQVLEEQYGVRVVQGRETLGITYTTAQEGELLDVPENTQVFFLSGIAANESGRPVEYIKSLVRADHVMFASTLTR